MRTYAATVRGSRHLSPNLISVTLDVPPDYPTTDVPDEYVRLLIPPTGQVLVLPDIDDDWTVRQPEGSVAPDARVYTVSDHRVVDGQVRIDLDVALHDSGLGSAWASGCRPGDQVGLIDPQGLYAAAPDTAWQLLVCDLPGLPALARILRGLVDGQRAEVVVVVTDAADEQPLPSGADVDVTWVVVDREVEIGDAVVAAVRERELPDDDRYVWVASEARATRAVRKYLRRELGWPQRDFSTCGYWQIDAERWNARYAEVADEVIAAADRERARVGDDDGAYLDALEEIYDRAGL